LGQKFFENTTLDAATAAHERNERKIKMQEMAIEKQRLKIEMEVL